MRNQNEFQEIENLGEDWKEEELEQEERRERGKRRGSLPIVQAVICVLIILALAVLKLSSPEVYGRVVEWYQNEAARQIELPRFEEREASPPPPSSQPTDSRTIGLLQEV